MTTIVLGIAVLVGLDMLLVAGALIAARRRDRLAAKRALVRAQRLFDEQQIASFEDAGRRRARRLSAPHRGGRDAA